MNKLNLKEKIGQLSANIFGWKAYKNNGDELTPYFFNELNKYGTIGSIYGVLRSDPWSQVTYENGLATKEFITLKKISDQVKKEINIAPFFFEEVPHGHQALDSITLPVNLAIGCTFNEKLYKQACSLVAQEVRSKGANVGLLSCLDLALDPRWGRTEECYGEDTYLSLTLAKNAIQGFQGNEKDIDNQHIGIVAKHFIGQGSALGGHNGGTVSIGENELNAHHLPIMESCIEANVLGVMAAYNDLDSMPCHINQKLLIDKLRNEMGFEGFVMSDGCAVDNLINYLPSNAHAISAALTSGINIDLWNVAFNNLEEAVKNKLIDENEIDKSLDWVLKSKSRFENLLFKNENYKREELQKINYELACESIVLLKNDNVLPIKNMNNTCLIGPYVDNIYHQLGDYTPFKDLNKVKSLSQSFNVPFSLGTYPRELKSELILEAVELAKKHKWVIMNLGSSSARDFSVKFDKNGAAIVDGKSSFMDCGEGFDVAEIALSQEQESLFNAVYEVNKNIILILTSGRPIGIEKIRDKAKAIIQSFYGGEDIAQALKDTILGINNPSGRLSISIPVNSAQLPVYYWMKETRKYVDLTNEPSFTFGSGLSYSNLKVNLIETVSKGVNKFVAKVEVKNLSNQEAKWPILIFANIKNTIIKPPKKQLVSFSKISILGNQSLISEVEIDVSWLHKTYKFKNIDFFIE